MTGILPDAAFGALGLLAGTVAELFRQRRLGALHAAPVVASAVVLVGHLATAVEWLLLALAVGGMLVPRLVIRPATTRGEWERDVEAMERRARWGFYLTGDRGWTGYSDITAWRLRAQTDMTAARPYLERAARRSSPYQSYAQLLLVAAFGDGDVAELVDERIRNAPKEAQPLLLDLALTWLILHGRTADALAMLGTVDPQVLRRPIHWGLLASLAAAIGDRGTLERVLAQHASEDSPGHAEMCRALADRALGNVEAGDRRLRSDTAPPGSLPAHFVAALLTHPTPVFDERALDGAAGRGLLRYRGFVMELDRTR